MYIKDAVANKMDKHTTKSYFSEEQSMNDPAFDTVVLYK